MDAIVTPELGCTGSREHSSSCSGDQPENGCDRVSRVTLQSADATVRRMFHFGIRAAATPKLRVISTLTSAIVISTAAAVPTAYG